MQTIIENLSLLLGPEFSLVKSGFIGIQDGIITAIGDGAPPASSRDAEIALNGSGLLAIPGLVDAHVHMGDSFAKDVGIGASLNELVHPIYGLKTKLLNEGQEESIRRAIASTSRDMISSGVTTFADFREGGIRGVRIELTALMESKQRALILGRPNRHFHPTEVVRDTALSVETMSELNEMVQLCAGVGLSGPNEYTAYALKQISELMKSKGKLSAIHAAESAEGQKFSFESFSISEAGRALRYLNPDFVVHFTHSTKEDIGDFSRAHIPVVCCPRANSILGLGFPPIFELLEANVTVALGTDNIMLNAPDMFREMDYTSRSLRAIRQDPAAVSSKQVFRMATLNGARALGLGSKVGSLEMGKCADIVFLNLNSSNLRFSQDLLGSIVHRARPEDVECVMVNGEVVHGSITHAPTLA